MMLHYYSVTALLLFDRLKTMIVLLEGNFAGMEFSQKIRLTFLAILFKSIADKFY